MRIQTCQPILYNKGNISALRINKSAVNNQNINNKVVSTLSFYGLHPNSYLVNMGYKPAKVENNKITNNENEIIITSPEQFIALNNTSNITNKKIVLGCNIDLQNKEINPIGNMANPFKGEFDGNGYNISNFKISKLKGRNVGLFGTCDKAKISNLSVKNAIIQGKQQIGGLIGYATNCVVDNCEFSGLVQGEKKIGGLIGYSNNNKIKHSYTDGTIEIDEQLSKGKDDFSITGIAGGIIGTDEKSELSELYSNAAIYSNNQAGGIIGYSNGSNIKDSNFKGKIYCDSKSGGLIGWAESSIIQDSYALSNKNNVVGISQNSDCETAYSDIKNITLKPFYSWDNNTWNISKGRLPRLKFQTENMTPEEIFLEDINIDVLSEKIKNIDSEIITNFVVNIKPPKHYESNNKTLEKIKNCNNTDKLRKLFGSVVIEAKDMINNGLDNSILDEVLLEFIKNPKMDLNTRLTSDDGGFYNVWCTPLFILTCLNKAYVLQEALKRDDADINASSGYSSNKTILKQALENHIDNCTYVLLSSPKMQEEINKNMNEIRSLSLSNFAKTLLMLYPNIPKLENNSIILEPTIDVPQEIIEELKEFTNLKQVQSSILIDDDYKDSQGNNIVNILTTIDDEVKALEIYLAAKTLGCNIDNYNNKSETPIGHAIYTKKPHLTAQILECTQYPYMRLADGTDSMLLFSKMSEEEYSINYMETARQKGLSVNSSDNNGFTPLINAANLKHSKAIKYLLKNGANPNLPDNSNQTPLHYACMNQDEESIIVLLDSYAYPNTKDDAGFLPIDYLNDELKNKLSDKFNDVINLYKISGINSENLNFSKYNEDEYSSYVNYEYLDEQISNNNETDKHILQLAKNAMINSGFKYTRGLNDNNILHLAAMSKSSYAKECTSIAINKGMNINLVNDDNETPLLTALNTYLCCNSDEERLNTLQIIKLLLDNNPDIDFTDNNKQSALHKVCQSGNVILLNEILKLNPKINQVDILGNTPFEYIPTGADKPMYLIAEKYLKDNKILK